ncbi:MAG: hypothetical protein U0802_11645 [Candidatus Binatia bacterium]
MQRPHGVVARLAQHHGHADVLPVQRVVERKRADVGGAGELLHHAVDVAGVDLGAALVDLVALAAAQEEPAARVERADVAGHEPAVADDLVGEVVALEVALHQRRRVEPDEARLAGGAERTGVEHSVRLAAAQHPHHRAPALADQTVLGFHRPAAEAGHPAAGLGDAVGVGDLGGAAPALDAAPHVGRERRRAAVDARQRAALRRAAELEGHAPDRGHRGEEGDRVLVDQGAEPHHRLGLEGRRDVEVATGQPREQAVADQAVAEVGRQHAQRAAEGREVERLSQRHPARAQRAVRVQDALRVAGGAGGEEDERVVVEPRRRRGRVVAGRGVVRGDHRRAAGGGALGDGRRGRVVDHRHPRPRRRCQGLHLERRQARVERDGAGAEAPDRQQLGEEFGAVAEVQEHPVAAAESEAAESARARRDLAGHRAGVPAASALRFDQTADGQVEVHRPSRSQDGGAALTVVRGDRAAGRCPRRSRRARTRWSRAWRLLSKRSRRWSRGRRNALSAAAMGVYAPLGVAHLPHLGKRNWNWKRNCQSGPKSGVTAL